MEYKIAEVFDHGQRRYFVQKRQTMKTVGEIGPFSYKKSARECIKRLKVNEKIMCLLNKNKGLNEEDQEAIFEILENTIDEVSE